MFLGAVARGANGLSEALLQGCRALVEQKRPLADMPFDTQAIWTDPCAVLIQQRRWNTPESRLEQGVILHPQTGVRILAWLRLDNRDELRAHLSAVEPELCQTDTGLALAAYLRWGEALGEHLLGDFSLVVYEPKAQHCLLVRDHLGVKPLYYYQDHQHLVFSSSMAAMLQIGACMDLSLNPEWMARYVAGCSTDWMETPYQRIQKVPPAHYLLYAHDQLRCQPYFAFEAKARLQLADADAYVEAYAGHLHEAVRCRTRSGYPMGSESSGGLDSSSVTALAAQYMDHPASDLHTFGFASCEQEPQTILAISQFVPMYSTQLISNTAEKNWQQSLGYQQFLQHYGGPDEHSNAIGHMPFYKMARHWGVRTLLSGFGGDEFVTNPAHMALVELWRTQGYRLWSERFGGAWFKRPLRMLRWLYQYYAHNNQFQTARILDGIRRQALQQSFLNADARAGADVDALVHQQHRFDSHCHTLNEFCLNDRWHPRMTARLENCTLMAAGAGLEYRWPLLDVRLLKFFLSVPVEYKLGRGGVGRFLHRQAMSGKIPDQVLWKGKSMGDVVHSPLQADSGPKMQLFEHIPDYQSLSPSIRDLLNAKRYQDNIDKVKQDRSLRNRHLVQQYCAVQKLQIWLQSLESVVWGVTRDAEVCA